MSPLFVTSTLSWADGRAAPPRRAHRIAYDGASTALRLVREFGKKVGPEAVSDANRLGRFIHDARADPAGTLVALDIDGTVSAIAPSPGEATVGGELRATLRRLSQRYHL